MAFRGQTLFYCLMLALLAGFLLHTLFTETATDLQEYQALFTPKEVKKHSTSRQERLRTEKTLLISEEGHRKRGVLNSRASELIYLQTPETNELQEQMEGIELLYQEEFTDEGQIITEMMADRALYFYNGQNLTAKGVKLKRYRIPGYEWPKEGLKDPFFIGEAKEAAVEMTPQGLTVKAQGLKAEIVP